MRKLSACLMAAILSGSPAVLAGPDRPVAGPSDSWSSPVEPHMPVRLGILAMSLTPELRSHFGAPSDRGVLVGKVEQGSMAWVAGLRVGDVLTSVHGEGIDDAMDVRAALMSAKRGDKVKLELVRDKKVMTVEAMVAPRAATDVGWLEGLFPWLEHLKQISSAQKQGASTDT